MSQVRVATTDDIAELVRLRALLFDSLSQAWGPASGAEWREECAALFAVHLGRDACRVLVIDAPDGLAACGVCLTDQWLPSPYNPTGTVAHILDVVTDPEHRKRGHARAITQELLRWCDERGVGRVDLHASPDAYHLYKDLGFADHPDPAMSRYRR